MWSSSTYPRRTLYSSSDALTTLAIVGLLLEYSQKPPRKLRATRRVNVSWMVWFVTVTAPEDGSSLLIQHGDSKHKVESGGLLVDFGTDEIYLQPTSPDGLA